MRGGVIPSPDGSQFVLSAELVTDPSTTVDIISVFDRNLTTRIQPEGFFEPVFIDNDHLLAHDGADIYVLDLVAKTATRVGPAGLGRPGEAPANLKLSPDNRSVAFIQDDELWRIDLDGSNLIQLTQRGLPLLGPTWSPDGSSMVVAIGSCPVFGTASPTPPVIVLSATEPLQDADHAPTLEIAGNIVRGCGPFYWLAN